MSLPARESPAPFLQRALAIRSVLGLVASDLIPPTEAELVASGAAFGILAVHEAIALADAAHAEVTGRHYVGDDHQAAAASLRRACGTQAIDPKGVDQFSKVVGYKHAFEYAARRIDPDDVKVALLALSRFRAWFGTNFGGLLG